jgi:hypothetical protein
MATKKAAKKTAAKKKKKKKKTLVDDPPIIVGGGGGSALTGQTLISLPKGTPKVATSGDYDVYRVNWETKTIVTKVKKTGTPKKSKPEADSWDTIFYNTDV